MRSLFLVLTLSLTAWATIPGAELDQKARAIADQLRCPVCRGIPVAESPSELARDMMAVIRQKLAEGQTEEEVLAYFEGRYGEWILLKPKPEGINLILWIVPALLLLGGAVFLVQKVSGWSRRQRN